MTAELSTKKLSFSFIQIKSVDISKQGGTKNEDEKYFVPDGKKISDYGIKQR